jgi:DNA-binding PadR family transcriptional regulator
MSGQQIKGHLDTMVMAVLEAGPAHGYAVIESLRARSGGTFDLPEGTVYPVLHRLEDAGLLTSSDEIVENRRRRVYRLAPAGRRSLERGRQSWTAFSAAMTAVVEVRPA